MSNYSIRFPQILAELKTANPDSIGYVSDTPGDPNDLYDVASRIFVEEFAKKPQVK